MILQFRTFLSLILVSIALSTAPAANAQDDAIDQLFELAGLTESIEMFPAHMRQGIVAAFQQRADVDQTAVDELLEAADQSITPEAVYTEMHRVVSESLNSDQIAELTRWYESDTAKLISAAEVAADSPEQMQFIMQNAQSLLAEEAAVQRAMRLEEVVLGVDQLVEMQINVTKSMIATMVAMEEGDTNADFDEIDKDLDAARLQMRERIEPVLIASYVHTYRDIDDTAMNAYIEFSAQPTPQRFMKAIMGGLTEGLAVTVSRWLSASAPIFKQISESSAE